MSRNKLPRIYCDACFFIEFLKGNSVRNGINTSEVCDKILEDAEAKSIEIFTSWGTFSECLKPPSELSTSPIQSVEDLFDYEFMNMCTLDRFIATDARIINLKAMGCTEYQHLLKGQDPNAKKIKKLGPFDAVHAATAIAMQVDYLFTYDDKHLIPLSGHDIVSKLTICHPFRPWHNGQRDIYDIEDVQ